MVRVTELLKVWSEVMNRKEDACRVDMYYTLVVVARTTPSVTVDKAIREK